MNFSLHRSIASLERTPAVCRAYFYDQIPDWTEVNEGEGTWSAYDIIGHFIHGEKTDWIPRARIILSDSLDKTFEPYDRFAQEHESKGKTMNQLLDEFACLRGENIRILKEWDLQPNQLSLKGMHPDPKLGAITLQQLISTWTVHDHSHLHQASRVLAKQYAEEVGPFQAYIRVVRT